MLTRVPLEVDAKVPLEVGSGDWIDVSVGLVDTMDTPRAVEVSVTADPAVRVKTPALKTSLSPAGRLHLYSSSRSSFSS